MSANLISDAEGIFPSNMSLAAFAAAFPGPMVATAMIRSPLKKNRNAVVFQQTEKQLHQKYIALRQAFFMLGKNFFVIFP